MTGKGLELVAQSLSLSTSFRAKTIKADCLLDDARITEAENRVLGFDPDYVQALLGEEEIRNLRTGLRK